ncbi:MAG: hypothetical protein R3A44_34570 [Caldilineaceae bacterium]
MYGGRHMGPLAILFLAVAFLTQQLLDITAAAQQTLQLGGRFIHSVLGGHLIDGSKISQRIGIKGSLLPRRP